MTIVKCDMCGKDISEFAFRIDGTIGDEKYEFCDDCYRAVKGFIKKYFASVKSGTAVPLKEASE